MDIIQSLRKNPFSERPPNEQKLIVTMRPVPKLEELKHKRETASYVRHFNPKYYDRYPWLAGSSVNKSLYCWPCLLFSNMNSTWNTTGYTKLNNLTTGIQVHGKSLSHKLASIRIIKFSDEANANSTNGRMLGAIAQHKKKVKENREILKKLINAVCLLGKLELPLPGNMSCKSSDRENYKELLDYTTQYDTNLLRQLEKSTLFDPISNNIQNDLAAAVAETMFDTVKNEIAETEFVSLMIDERGASTIGQFSLIARYCRRGEIHERFLKFVDGDVMAANQNGVNLCDILEMEAKELGCEKKIVALSLDGAVVPSELDKVQAEIKQRFGQHVYLVHYHAHTFNSVLAQSMNSIPGCRLFFATLKGIGDFFCKCPERRKLLEEFLQRHLPTVRATQWNYSSRIVDTVFEHKGDLRTVFNEIIEHQNELDENTLSKVQGHLTNLQNFSFCFLLSVLNEIFKHTSDLYNISTLDFANFKSEINVTMERLIALRTETVFERIYYDVFLDIGQPNRNEQLDRPKLNRLFYEIIDKATKQIDTRFQDYNKLEYFLPLLDREKYDNGSAYTELIQSFVTTKPNKFDPAELKSDLTLVHSRGEFPKSPSDLYSYLWSSKLQDVLSQVTKLASLFCTLPISIMGTDSCLERVKSYDRSRTYKFSLVPILFIEKALLKKMQSINETEFYDKVTENFARGNRKNQFLYEN